MGSRVFIRVLNKGRTQVASAQGVRCGIRSVSWGGRELNKGRTHLSSGAGGELLAQDCLPGI